MNTRDMTDNLINRAKNLQEFTVTTDCPEDFRFNGVVPYNLSIKNGVISAVVHGVDFDEAVTRLNNYLETCK